MAQNNLVLLLKSLIAKCNAGSKGNSKCVCVTMCFLMTSIFLRNYIKMVSYPEIEVTFVCSIRVFWAYYK